MIHRWSQVGCFLIHQRLIHHQFNSPLCRAELSATIQAVSKRQIPTESKLHHSHWLGEIERNGFHSLHRAIPTRRGGHYVEHAACNNRESRRACSLTCTRASSWGGRRSPAARTPARSRPPAPAAPPPRLRRQPSPPPPAAASAAAPSPSSPRKSPPGRLNLSDLGIKI